MNFNMHELDAGDGNMFTGENPNDKFEKDNLIEVGLSEGLATALDGKTVGEFQDIVTNTIESGQDVNLEMFLFAQNLFASYHDTGYENDEANKVLNTFEGKLQAAWPTREVQGLAYDYEGTSGATEGKKGSPDLPAELALNNDAECKGTGYFGTVTPTDVARCENGM